MSFVSFQSTVVVNSKSGIQYNKTIYILDELDPRLHDEYIYELEDDRRNAPLLFLDMEKPGLLGPGGIYLMQGCELRFLREDARVGHDFFRRLFAEFLEVLALGVVELEGFDATQFPEVDCCIAVAFIVAVHSKALFDEVNVACAVTGSVVLQAEDGDDAIEFGGGS